MLNACTQKVFLPAIAGLVPDKMVKAIAKFMDFCYLVRQSSFDGADLAAIDDSLSKFQEERAIFIDSGVRPKGISLPRQHALQHFHEQITLFGAPNGLSTSITESRHKDLVKKPYRRSNHFKALGQMLLTNQRQDKLAALHGRLSSQGLLDTPLLPEGIEAIPMGGNATENEDMVDGPDKKVEAFVGLSKIPGEYLFCVLHPNSQSLPVKHFPKYARDIADSIGIPEFPELLQRFLYDQQNPSTNLTGSEVDISQCPDFRGKIKVFTSASATFYAPSDHCSIGGMTTQKIRCTPSWRDGPACYDCVYVERDPTLPGFKGLYLAQVVLLFSFEFRSIHYPCALVKWFIQVGDEPCPVTGMWRVQPEHHDNDQDESSRVVSVIHLESILRPAHLIPVFGDQPVDHDLHFSHSLLAFKTFYVNKFSDYHAYCLAF